MPVEVKPLFRPDVLGPKVRAFGLPERVAAQVGVVRKWAELLGSEEGERFKEQELLPEFLGDIFGRLLGYTGPAESPERYTLSRERHVEVGGKFADAVLGVFGGSRVPVGTVAGQTAHSQGPARQAGPTAPRYVVAVEGKGPTDPLDRPFKSRSLSAVDQGYRYAINLPCDWIVVTSMRQTRLYYKGADQLTYERFLIGELAENERTLRRFVFLLGAERVVPERGPCHLDQLREASERAGREVTREFYERYANMREDVFEQLCAHNHEVARTDVLSAAQRLLDRVLFCAFCEDRGLLPEDTLADAFAHRDPYNPRPVWENFRGLFRAINTGNASLDIPEYNGGLFAEDELIERLKVPDAVCRHFHDIGEYSYRPASESEDETDGDGAGARGRLVDVDILGHIFEQSITDLEVLRNELTGLVAPAGKEKHRTRRKKEGAFYTPAFITRYIVEQTLGGVLGDRFEALRSAHQRDASGGAAKALADPRVYDVDALKSGPRTALVRFWEAWQDELATVRILDPACGSGAFLIEAFDQLHAAYVASNDRLEELRGHRTLFDLDRQILQYNLYGVDLNAEAIEICRLSLWIKTAQRGKVLTSLDHTIRVGNSVVDDPAVHPLAFDWAAAFPEVTAAGGFDVVVGNPPYISQQWLQPYKAHWQERFASYHGTADIYVYFYELGFRLLRPGGRLSFVVTNKWMKATYGEPLRRYFAENAWVESVVDFGHAKQIFVDADVFPSVVVIQRPRTGAGPKSARVCVIPREQLRIDSLSEQIAAEGYEIPRTLFGPQQWTLEAPRANALLQKIRRNGVSLAEFARVGPLRGVTTGYNEAFLVDTPTRNKLVSADPACAEIIKPYLRGQDLERWHSKWTGLWMIFARRGVDIERFPSVKEYLLGFRARLEPKPPGHTGNWPGRKPGAYQWFEIQDTTDYWEEFLKPKIIYPEITWRPQWSLDRREMLCSNTVYFVPTDDRWILAVANSPACWWYSWRTALHGKDEALRFLGVFVRDLPIPAPSDEQRSRTIAAVDRLIEISAHRQSVVADMLDWLKTQHDIEKPGTTLSEPLRLDADEFAAEVKRRRGRDNPLSVAALKSLREEYARSIEPHKVLLTEAARLEQQVSDCVNEAYGLTAEEVELMWKTAPPRMPSMS